MLQMWSEKYALLLWFPHMNEEELHLRLSYSAS